MPTCEEHGHAYGAGAQNPEYANDVSCFECAFEVEFANMTTTQLQQEIGHWVYAWDTVQAFAHRGMARGISEREWVRFQYFLMEVEGRLVAADDAGSGGLSSAALSSPLPERPSRKQQERVWTERERKGVEE